MQYSILVQIINGYQVAFNESQNSVNVRLVATQLPLGFFDTNFVYTTRKGDVPFGESSEKKGLVLENQSRI